MQQVISASRRTDIPAFYPDWFVNRLKAEFVIVRHPFTRKYFRVSLKPEDVGAIVFWSKNYSPLLSRLETIEQTTKNLFFHYTITGTRELEPDTPDIADAIQNYFFLVRRYSAEQVVWRFDPICITDKLSFEVFEERFVRCARLLKGHTRNCFISFAHPYKKVIHNMHRAKQSLTALPEDLKQEYTFRLAARADTYGIRLSACCNDYLVSGPVQKASCINGQHLSALFNMPLDTRRASSRKECGCTKSTDIGAYDTCAHGCVYCYATSDKDKAMQALQQHDPEWNSLAKQVEETTLGRIEEQIALNI